MKTMLKNLTAIIIVKLLFLNVAYSQCNTADFTITINPFNPCCVSFSPCSNEVGAWDFDDGYPMQQTVTSSHCFPRFGNFNVRHVLPNGTYITKQVRITAPNCVPPPQPASCNIVSKYCVDFNAAVCETKDWYIDVWSPTYILYKRSQKCTYTYTATSFGNPSNLIWKYKLTNSSGIATNFQYSFGSTLSLTTINADTYEVFSGRWTNDYVGIGSVCLQSTDNTGLCSSTTCLNTCLPIANPVGSGLNNNNHQKGDIGNDLYIYPNPALSGTKISINLPNIEDEKPSFIELMDVNGRIINSKTIKSGVIDNLRMDNLAKGLYIVTVFNKKREILYRKKLVIN